MPEVKGTWQWMTQVGKSCVSSDKNKRKLALQVWADQKKPNVMMEACLQLQVPPQMIAQAVLDGLRAILSQADPEIEAQLTSHVDRVQATLSSVGRLSVNDLPDMEDVQEIHRDLGHVTWYGCKAAQEVSGNEISDHVKMIWLNGIADRVKEQIGAEAACKVFLARIPDPSIGR